METGPLPRAIAREYLEKAPTLLLLLLFNVVLVLVGIRYYVETMPGVGTFLWPFYADSPTATFLMALSLSTLLPFLGRSLDDVPANRTLAYLHTIAFVWLVKMGLWTAVALHLRVGLYFPEPRAYFGVVLTHLAFVAEALLIPHYGRTTRGALALALVLALGNDLLDYGFGYAPPLRYDPGVGLAGATVAVSLFSVALAALLLPRLDESGK